MRNYFTIALFLITTIGYSQLDPNGLLAYYNFDSNFNNQISNNHHLTPVSSTGNPANNPVFVPGNANQAVSFSGANALVNTTLANHFQNISFDEFSISYWIKAPNSSFITGAFKTHFEAFESVFVRNNGPLQYGTATSPTVFNVDSSSPFSDGNIFSQQWEHLTLIYSRDGTSNPSARKLSLYRNNRLVAETSFLASTTSNNHLHQFTNQFILGAGSSGGAINYPTKGLACEIDEFIIYDRDIRDTPGLLNDIFTKAYLNPLTPPYHTLCQGATINDLTEYAPNLRWATDPTSNQWLGGGVSLVNNTTYWVRQGSNGTRYPTLVFLTPNETPTFTQVDPICLNDPLAPLPTISNNGYTGTWSPVLSNTITTTYTFTPTPGQGCVANTTMTINVDRILITPVFTPVTTVCDGTFLNLPTTSNDGVTGSWSFFFSNGTQQFYIFTPDPGQGCYRIAEMQPFITPAGVTPTFTQVDPVCADESISLPTTSNNGIVGTWSPAINNQATTTYTFTPGGNCSPTVNMTVVVNPTLVPSFTQVAAICQGDTLAALPTTSNNGIAGTWSPTINNQATTTYTFTPTSTALCEESTTMTIDVNPVATPVFTQVAPICQGDSLSALPTTSTNGISGSWSPALNNQTTTTYTFTPSSGVCASTETMTIVVNPSVTAVFTQVAPICQGELLSALPTVSNNGISGTWSPTLNNQSTTTYTFTPGGSCSPAVNMTIVVNPSATPSFTQVAPICAGETLSPLPTTSNNGISGVWTPALNNMATTTYTFTPSTTGSCATTAAMTIRIDPPVVPSFTQVDPVCEGATLSALPTTSNNGITGTWSPRISSRRTTTYTFTPDTGLCATATTMTIVINPRNAASFNQVAPICAGDFISALPLTSNDGITGRWFPAINNQVTTTYTFTPNLGQCGNGTTMTIVVNPTGTPTFTQVDPICAGDNLSPLPTISNNGIAGSWTPVINNQATTTYTFTGGGSCGTTTTMTIVVNPSVVPTFTQVSPICEGDALSPLPTTSINGVSGSWTPALNNLSTTTYTFTPTPTGSCIAQATLTIVVNSTVTPSFTQVASICQGDVLSALPTTSNNGVTGSWSPALNNQSTTTYTFTPSASCATTATMTIVVNVVTPPSGSIQQSFNSGATLADIIVAPATGIEWYLSINDASNRVNQLQMSTILVDATTYYAINYSGICSSQVFAVTVDVTLSVNYFTQKTVKLYPNPFTDHIIIDLDNTNETVKVDIHDLLGKQLYKGTFSGDHIVVEHLEGLPRGMYMITLTSKNGSKIIKKMVK
jgi:hypothetical protein